MSVPATEGVEGSTGTVETGALPSRSAEPAVIQGKEAAVREKEAAIDGLKKELEQQRASLRLKVRQNKDELSQLEEKQTAEVLADMYELLQKVAKDENVTIIIDKNDILYGQASLDLTDKVRERLQGR
jgi:Skp family chaperone for outer membrane proteins